MYLFLPDRLPLVDHAANALAALLLLSSQLPQAHRGFGPFAFLCLCFRNLFKQTLNVATPSTQCSSVNQGAKQRGIIMLALISPIKPSAYIMHRITLPDILPRMMGVCSNTQTSVMRSIPAQTLNTLQLRGSLYLGILIAHCFLVCPLITLALS